MTAFFEMKNRSRFPAGMTDKKSKGKGRSGNASSILAMDYRAMGLEFYTSVRLRLEL
jgi:hypothetical protein